MDDLNKVEALRRGNSILRDVLRACFKLLRIANPPFKDRREWLEKRKLILSFTEQKLDRLSS